MITSILDERAPVYSGMVVGRPLERRTGVASERIYFGKGVSIAPASDLTLDPVLNLFTDTQQFMGVSVADTTLEALADPVTGIPNTAPFGAHSANRPFGYVRKGLIWVHSDTAITSRALGVFVKDEDGLGTPATVLSTAFAADSSALSFTVTIAGFAVQTVTMPAGTTSLAAAATQINLQIAGGYAQVVGSQIQLVTYQIGSTMTIAATDSTTDITWDTPVAGTGDPAIYDWNARGTFHASTAATPVAGYTEVTAYSEWQAAKTVNGRYYGLLEVKL